MEKAQILDKNAYKKTITTLGILIPAKETNNYLKIYKQYLLNIDKQPNIAKDYIDNQNKLLLLNQQYKLEEISEWPQEIRSLVDEKKLATLKHEITLGFDDMSAHEIFKLVLPPDVMIPAGFETVGTIAHLNLRKGQLEYKNLIGSVILEKNKGITTVVNKTDKLNNVFRTPELEIIAGKNSLETEQKEAGSTFKLNFEKVYWNSKLQGERDRLLKIFKPDEVLCDMFCGIGPLSIRAAKIGMKVYANDLNPECFHYLKLNSSLNKVDHLVNCYNMDAREFIRDLIKCSDEDIHFDHVYMNLPVDALEFLDVFRGVFSLSKNRIWREDNLPTVHVCGFDSGKDDQEVRANFSERINRALGFFDQSEFIYIHQIKDITHEKKMYCLGFKIPAKIAFQESENEEHGEQEPSKKIKKV